MRSLDCDNMCIINIHMDDSKLSYNISIQKFLNLVIPVLLLGFSGSSAATKRKKGLGKGVIVPFPLVEISYYCRKILGVIFSTDFLTFCIEILYDRFESPIWILCTYYRDLRTPPIDSPRNFEQFSFFKRPKRPYIPFFR